jgi:hypothetical protein
MVPTRAALRGRGVQVAAQGAQIQPLAQGRGFGVVAGAQCGGGG